MKRLLISSGLSAAIVGIGHLHGQSPLSPPVRHYDPDQLSKSSYHVKMEIDVRVPMRDGVTLSADIYRPDAEGRFPAIVFRTPYSNNTEGAIAMSKFFAQRGYVFVYQDVRGKFDSDGQFYPQRNEANDGYDTDEWIGKQPWFSGKLGAMGGSYNGYTPWAQAVQGSSVLTAMAPWVTTTDLYNNWYYNDGALSYAFALSWGAVSIDGRVAQTTSAFDWEDVYRHLPIATSPDAAGHRAPHYRDWVAHPTRDSYWDDLNLDAHYDKISVPILIVEGWYDIFLRGGIQDYLAMRKKAKTQLARDGTKITIGPWKHGVTGTRTNSPAGQPPPADAIDFGPDAEVNLQNVYLRWFDHWLKGIGNGVVEEPPIKIFVMGEKKWRFEREWPLARTQYTNYYLSSHGKANSVNGDGVLSTQAPTAGTAASDGFSYDPVNPVPTLGGNVCCAATVPFGPYDQRRAEQRDDVLVFTSEPLGAPLEVTGPMVMKLFAATSARDTDWTAKLVDVEPDGFARNVQDGILRGRYREAIGKQGTLLEPGKVYEYTIDMWATSNTFLPGHQIRLEISSSNFPRFDRNLNTGEEPATGTRMMVARQTIYHNAAYPSHVVLPVIPRGTSSN
jgi:putative CocE/NonD family hydrolase